MSTWVGRFANRPPRCGIETARLVIRSPASGFRPAHGDRDHRHVRAPTKWVRPTCSHKVISGRPDCAETSLNLSPTGLITQLGAFHYPAVTTQEGAQRLGDQYAAVGLLVVLHDGDHHAGKSQTRAIQSM